MEKNEFHAVIKHLHMKCLTPKEIKAELDNVHSTSAPAFATVYNWVNEFKRGRTSTCDAPRSGRPIREAATLPEIIDKRPGISHGTVISILHEQLSMKKLLERWVPRLLTVDHKRDRMTISKQCLEMFQRNPDEFLHRFITVDEIWIHYFTPEMKEQSKHWTQTINGDYYSALLDHFNNILKKKLPHLAKKKKSAAETHRMLSNTYGEAAISERTCREWFQRFRRTAIIEGLRAGRSATETIRFFRYPRSTVYDVVAKYTALEQSNEDSSMPARKSHSKEGTARTPAVVEKRIMQIVEDLRYESYTLKIRQMLSETSQDKPSCSPRLPF
ncbi:SETMR methyltransferase, partial [Acromyrmex charruanus]